MKWLPRMLYMERQLYSFGICKKYSDESAPSRIVTNCFSSDVKWTILEQNRFEIIHWQKIRHQDSMGRWVSRSPYSYVYNIRIKIICHCHARIYHCKYGVDTCAVLWMLVWFHKMENMTCCSTPPWFHPSWLRGKQFVRSSNARVNYLLDHVWILVNKSPN